jgi:hypothetical protein
VRPTGNPAFQMIERLKRRQDCPYVLPVARGGDGFYGGLSSGWQRITGRGNFRRLRRTP